MVGWEGKGWGGESRQAEWHTLRARCEQARDSQPKAHMCAEAAYLVELLQECHLHLLLNLQDPKGSKKRTELHAGCLADRPPLPLPPGGGPPPASIPIAHQLRRDPAGWSDGPVCSTDTV